MRNTADANICKVVILNAAYLRVLARLHMSVNRTQQIAKSQSVNVRLSLIFTRRQDIEMFNKIKGAFLGVFPLM